MTSNKFSFFSILLPCRECGISLSISRIKCRCWWEIPRVAKTRTLSRFIHLSWNRYDQHYIRVKKRNMNIESFEICYLLGNRLVWGLFLDRFLIWFFGYRLVWSLFLHGSLSWSFTHDQSWDLLTVVGNCSHRSLGCYGTENGGQENYLRRIRQLFINFQFTTRRFGKNARFDKRNFSSSALNFSSLYAQHCLCFFAAVGLFYCFEKVMLC